MAVGVLTVHVHLPGCKSLKEKRARLAPLVNQLRKEFNVAVAEVEDLDAWQSVVIGCATISNDRRHTESTLSQVSNWLNNRWLDVEIEEEQVEIL